MVDEVRSILDNYSKEIFLRLDKIDASIAELNKEIIKIHVELAKHESCIKQLK
jgi:hypothetical protein